MKIGLLEPSVGIGRQEKHVMEAKTSAPEPGEGSTFQSLSDGFDRAFNCDEALTCLSLDKIVPTHVSFFSLLASEMSSKVSYTFSKKPHRRSDRD